MAAGESSRPLKPKLPQQHSEAAKAAMAAVQARLDMEEAQFNSQMTMRRAQAKNQGSSLATQGRNIDMAMQARADAEAAGMEEPVGPQINVAPLPDGRNQSQTGGIDLNALLQQPGAIQGGAAIQQATGGMGRAQPSDVNPQQLQGQVSPYNVSQQITEGTRSSQIAPGMVMNQPTVERTTKIEPNTLTPYQVGRLQQESVRTKVAAFKEQFAAEGDLAKELAGTLYGVQKGYLDPKDLDMARLAMRDTLKGMGLSDERAAAVEARAQTAFGKYASEQTDKSSTEFMKTVHARNQQPIGSPEWKNYNDRLKYMTGNDDLSGSQRRYWDTMVKGPVIEIQEKNARQAQTIGLLERIHGLTISNPEAFGASGNVLSGATAVGGAISSLSDLLPAKEQQDLIAGASEYMPQLVQESLGADGKMDAESSKIFNEYRNKLYNPELKGTLGQLEAALRILYAGVYFKTLNVRAVETVMKDKIKLTGLRSVEEVRKALEASIGELNTLKYNTELHMQSAGIPVLPYSKGIGGGGSIYRGTVDQAPAGLPQFMPSNPNPAPR